MEQQPAIAADLSVRKRFLTIDGIRLCYREAGPADAPVLLLLHGHPASSHQFRNLMPLLADRWRLIAPDLPGFGESATPEAFDYSFDGYAQFLEKVLARLKLRRFALYLHDYGCQSGLRLACARPDRVDALIVQNGDIYADTLGPQYADHTTYFGQPTEDNLSALAATVSEEGFRQEFVTGLDADLQARFPPEMWQLHWSQMTDKRKAVALSLMVGLRDNAEQFTRFHAYLRNHRPPVLIVWGPQNGWMQEDAARAWLRDAPHAELHILKAGHWLLETHLDEAASLVRDFLMRVGTPQAL